MDRLVSIEEPTALDEVYVGATRPSRAIMKKVLSAVHRFKLFEPGDRIALGCSGGKDSLLMIAVFRELIRRTDFDFDFRVIHLDQQQPGFNHEQFRRTLERLEVECEVISRDTWSVVEERLRPGQIPCSICSRLRRGILNEWCAEHGYNKLAMGHHLDDAVETFFLNLFYGRRLDPLKPFTPTTAARGPTTIRPMLLVDEEQIKGWLKDSGLKAVACPVCDDFPASKRRDTKVLIGELSGRYPDLKASVESALYEDTKSVERMLIPEG